MVNLSIFARSSNRLLAERIAASALDQVVVTDTIALGPVAARCEQIVQPGLDRLRAEAIRRVGNEESVSAMFH